MEVQITSRRRIPGLRSQKIKQKARKVLKDLDLHDVELSILLTDDAVISELNRRYLCKNGPTNVLAFPMGEESLSEEPAMLGDVVISGQDGEPCLTHELWCDLSAQIHDFLASIDLQQLVERRSVREISKRQEGKEGDFGAGMDREAVATT